MMTGLSNFRRAAARLAVAALLPLLLAAPPARADLSATVTFPTTPGARHFSLVTLPYSQFVAADSADASRIPQQHPCVQPVGGAPAGDGVIDDIDVLCDLYWQAPATRKSAVVSQFDPVTCQYTNSVVSAGFCDPGSCWLDQLTPQSDMGFWLSISNLSPFPDAVITFTGPCDPPFPGRWIQPTTCRSGAELLHFPYNARYLKADEILCGEQGVDWFDADGNGRPDSCPNGLFDGVHGITVQTYDCDHVTQPATDHQYVPRSVVRTAFGTFFGGTNFDLRPGDAYWINFSPQQSPIFWNPPTDPCPP